jgi:hypothetical protein
MVAAGRVIYVDDDAPPGGHGSSWTNAYNHLQDALAAADPSDEIWVAAGIYKADRGAGQTPGDRQATFQLISGVALYGGFPSGGGTWDDRNPDIYETILSGDLNGNDVDVNDPCDLLTEPTRADNSHHVVRGSGTNSTAMLDGLTVTAGNANGSSYSNNRGGGIYNYSGSPTLISCAFSQNSSDYRGGAMYNHNSSSQILIDCTFEDNSARSGAGIHNNASSNPTLTACIFRGNLAEVSGGGMRNAPNCEPILIGCVFSHNVADLGGGMYNGGSFGVSKPRLANCTFEQNSSRDGGGMCNRESDPTLTNCRFTGNSATHTGGGMHNHSASPKVANCTFERNSSEEGGGMYNLLANPRLTNCTFTKNVARQGDGGGMKNYSSNLTLANCAFNANAAYAFGGAMAVFNSNTSLTKCTFSGNYANQRGGGTWIYLSSVTLTDCILWSNVARWGPQIFLDHNSSAGIRWSNIQGGRGTLYVRDSTIDWREGNIDVNPLLTPDGHLRSGLPHMIAAGRQD